MKIELNRQVLLINRPNGEPSDSNFTIVEQPLKRPGEGEMLIRIFFALYLPMTTRISIA
ncbi:NADPH-dependent curcumin reductase CurA [Paenibacillus harenae]|nr:NADPH-dependent curcumin reductase CurA [Paenibacillus harenae]